MQAANLFTRDDTLLGVCEALGQDFGFNPLWLRLAFTLAVFWNPVAAIGVYLALGTAVLLSRLIFPDPRLAAQPEAELVEADAADEEQLAVAA